MVNSLCEGLKERKSSNVVSVSPLFVADLMNVCVLKKNVTFSKPSFLSCIVYFDFLAQIVHF